VSATQHIAELLPRQAPKLEHRRHAAGVQLRQYDDKGPTRRGDGDLLRRLRYRIAARYRVRLL
jgi:hypothetical protein